MQDTYQYEFQSTKTLTLIVGKVGETIKQIVLHRQPEMPAEASIKALSAPDCQRWPQALRAALGSTQSGLHRPRHPCPLKSSFLPRKYKWVHFSPRHFHRALFTPASTILEKCRA